MSALKHGPCTGQDRGRRFRDIIEHALGESLEQVQATPLAVRRAQLGAEARALERVRTWAGGAKRVTTFNMPRLCERCCKPRLHKCPECGQQTCGNCAHGNCNSVRGRRGWRRLGDYDG